MSSATEFASGKGHRDENFPVASLLIHPRHRAVILDFYRFARAADDVADSATATAQQKLALLENMRASLTGEAFSDPNSVALKVSLARHALDNSHALDLLEAFRRDVTKLRYESWDDLLDYCRYSAMPVGRFVLDVHKESLALWPQSDALCAALQVINHLQDCQKDYRELDRIYIPRDRLAAAGLAPEVLDSPKAPPALLAVIRELAQSTAALLAQSRPFATAILDRRLGLEVAVIQGLAEDLNLRLLDRDPLCERVHHRKSEALGLALRAGAHFFASRFRPKTRPPSFVRQP
jgi:hydroxysqualene synthase